MKKISFGRILEERKIVISDNIHIEIEITEDNGGAFKKDTLKTCRSVFSVLH